MNKRNYHSKPATDRPAEADELNFEDDAPTRDLDETAEEETIDPTIRTAGLTEASQPGEGPTNDDLTQETLILEDGARSPHEPQQGNVEPADKTLSIVHDDEIGAGSGLDEAELARAEPLNKGKRNSKNGAHKK
ncbi:MAG: hypothetical protein B0W54_00350 [Cellvibrio sp. 79]|nr:MAG: hypothetical protein B0W54_00350 [Cellvibrio sp. 79]